MDMPSHDRISLRQRVFNAGFWSLAGYGIGQIIRLGSSLLMTRLLVPEMFGVMAIATMVIVGLNMLSDIGLKQSVIRSDRGTDAAFLNTAWVIQIVRGGILWLCAEAVALLLFLGARADMFPKNAAYADPSLPSVILVLSFIALIGGFQSTKLFQESRNLSLGRLTKVEAVSQIAGLSCMIGWASIDRSIWALVAGNICTTLTMTLMSHAWLPGTSNRLQWESAASWEIIHFGKWIFVSSILGFLVNSGDRIMLGGMVDAGLLGVYMIAFGIFSAVEQVLSKIINDVSYPALSEIVRARGDDLKSAYYKFHIPLGSFVVFCSGVLMTSGQVIVSYLYDDRYTEAGWMLQVLAIGLLAIPYRLTAIWLLSLGMSKAFSEMIAIRFVVLFAATPLGFYFLGLPGALFGIVLSHFAALPLAFVYMLRRSLFDIRRELPLLAGLLLGVVVGSTVSFALSVR